jgi:hypothetical protein
VPIPFLIISSTLLCRLANSVTAEPCNCFHQPNVESRRDVSWSTVRHLCLSLNMNGSRKRSSSAGSEKMERVGDR